jgi:DNA polymerase-3 subunit alpha
MSQPSFVHLRVHTEFSITDGLTRIDDLVKAAKADGMGAVAVTDAGNLFGLVKFYKAARGKGIKPVVGVDISITNPKDRDAAHRLLLLARDRAGYLQLCELLTRAFLTNQYRGRPEMQADWLTPESASGLIALSGGAHSELARVLQAQGDAAAVARAWSARFPGRYFIELQRDGTAACEHYTQAAAQLAAQLGLPVVATHPVEFIAPADFRAHEARVCIAEGEILGNPRRVKRFTEHQYFKSQAEMAQLFADMPQAVANSVAIAQACNLALELGKPKLPLFPTPDGMTLDDYLVHLSKEGLEKRLIQRYPDAAQRESKRPDYEARLKIECDTIIKMGFPGYFLIVQDFINWGKENGVPVGPGRGSGAGSLVAYALGITDLDPLPYDLLFERFLNPERVSMPDFDIDFCQDNRDRVIDYVKRRYGSESVSQIATFGTLGAKAVIRDVGRVLDLPYKYCDGLSKLIPHQPTDPWDLKRALEEEPTFKERVENEEEAREIIELAKPLEGVTRSVGMHAGGVLIAPGKLTDFCPLYCAEGSEDSAVSQFDKDDVEAVGLVKFDFLGLRNLTILELAVQYVRQMNADRREFTLDDLAAFDDKATYKLFADGNTTAVFQMESRSARDLCKKLKPTVFEDIVALNALNRPGPLGSGMVDDFIARKKEQTQTGRGKMEWYFHEKLEPVLKSTYGVIVYQEQVMLVAQVLAGYTLGGADLLRRAMGKKKKEEMDKQREIFVTGATERGVKPELATELFNLMEKFADYGFNKSHSAAYAVIGYQTAWLKCHYPAEFMAATMSADMDATDKVMIFHADTLAQKVTVLGPDINLSQYRFVPVPDEHHAKGKPTRTIRYGLGAVKGTGQSAIEAIVAERDAHGPFKDLFDFCRRIDKKVVNRRAIEALIKAGAFDALNNHRAQLLASLEAALTAAEAAAASASQTSLFGDVVEAAQEISLADVPRFDDRAQLAEEKTALGFYFSGHLFNAYKGEVRKLVPKKLEDVEPAREPQWLAGIASAVRTQIGKRGKMAFVTLDDGTATLEVMVYGELFAERSKLLAVDELVVIQGKVSEDSYSGGVRIIANEVYSLDELRAARASGIVIRGIQAGVPMAQLKRAIEPFRSPAGCPVRLDVRAASGLCEMRLPDEWKLKPDAALVAAAKSLGLVLDVEYG